MPFFRIGRVLNGDGRHKCDKENGEKSELDERIFYDLFVHG